MRKLISACLAATLGMMLFMGVAIAAPANDDMSGAIVVADLPFSDARSTKGATVEVGEPEATCPAGGAPTGASVWYSHSATSDAPLIVRTFGSKFDTVVSVHSGPAMTEIACNDDIAGSGGQQSELTFVAENGADYLIRVAGYEGAQGFLQLAIEVDPMAFDSFGMAREIGSLPFLTEVNLTKATTEPGEPSACDGYEDPANTVWFRMTVASETGIRASTDGVDALLSVFEGTSLETLSYLSCNHMGSGGAMFKARPGSVYYFQIGMHTWNPLTDVPFSVSQFTSPANDDFADAFELSGFGARHEMATSGATDEPGEPFHNCSYAEGSVWYKLTSSESDSLVVTTKDSDYDTVVSVYTGDSFEDLQALACNDEAGLVRNQAFAGWPAIAGETYYIQVSGYYGFSGNLVIEIARGATLEEDYFLPAQVGAAVSEDGSLEAGAGTGALLAFGGVMVTSDPEGKTSVNACAGAVFTGICLFF